MNTSYIIDTLETYQWLYVEGMTVGTHQRHGSTQASASIVQAQKYGSS